MPEAAGSLLMPVVMGNQRAALKLYTGDWITADEAVECGLALRAVEPEELMPETMDLARRIAQDAGRVVARDQAGRRSRPHRRGAGPRGPARTARSRGMIGQPANMEAITAFLEKREPDFSRSVDRR